MENYFDPSYELYTLTGLTRGSLKIRLKPTKKMRSRLKTEQFLDKSFTPVNLASEINMRVAERLKQALIKKPIESCSYYREFRVRMDSYETTLFEDIERFYIDIDPKKYKHWVPDNKRDNPEIYFERRFQLRHQFDEKKYHASLELWEEHGERISYSKIVPLLKRIEVSDRGVVDYKGSVRLSSETPKRSERKRLEDDLYRTVLSFMEIQ